MEGAYTLPKGQDTPTFTALLDVYCLRHTLNFTRPDHTTD